jgi:hypothetical protein
LFEVPPTPIWIRSSIRGLTIGTVDRHVIAADPFVTLCEVLVTPT